MEFSYRVMNEQVEITAYSGTESMIRIPEALEGYPVTAIGKYTFEGNQNIVEVILPDTIETIGEHAFYNCRRMAKMSMPDRITQAGDGVFKNCRSLREFHIRVMIEKMTCLKNLLSELNQELIITMEYCLEQGKSVVSQLVFPKYLYDYVDNVEARIINQVTYGSGVHYRECMKEHDVDYRRYDETFRVALHQDSVATLSRIARYRMTSRYELGEDAERTYQNYIEENFTEIVEQAIKEEDREAFQFLLTHQFCNQENIEMVLELAHGLGNTEFVGILLEYKNQHLQVKKKSFDL